MLLIKTEEKNKKDIAKITSYIRSYHETFVATIITIYRANLLMHQLSFVHGVRKINDTSRQLT